MTGKKDEAPEILEGRYSNSADDVTGYNPIYLFC